LAEKIALDRILVHLEEVWKPLDPSTSPSR
jgi:hypothetical protein